MNPEFWRGKRVLLTGHTGFKGSWLSLCMQTMGANVIGYALAPPTNPSLFELADVARDMTSILGDVRDLAYLKTVLTEHQPEIIIHMAAQTIVRYSYREPVETYAVNVMGTVNLLEAVRNTSSVKAVVNVTTDKCYENREWVWAYRENEEMGGYDPYSNSKGCSELVTSAYRNSYFHPDQYLEHGVAIASGRAGNVIGGGDWTEDQLIPDIMRAITQGKVVKIRSPHAIRPWQHVMEPLTGYLRLAEKLYTDGAVFSGGWNFGPFDDDAKPVQWIVEQLTKAWSNEATWILDDATHPHEANYLKLDCSKAKTYLAWKPKWHLEEALSHIVDWQRQYQLGNDMKAFSLKQIDQYLKS